MNNPVLKPRLEDYTESEFLQLLGMIDAALNQGWEKEADDLVEHFQRIAGHSGSCNVPIDEIKHCRHTNNISSVRDLFLMGHDHHQKRQ